MLNFAFYLLVTHFDHKQYENESDLLYLDLYFEKSNKIQPLKIIIIKIFIYNFQNEIYPGFLTIVLSITVPIGAF
jgi:hypothetical protein